MGGKMITLDKEKEVKNRLNAKIKFVNLHSHDTYS